MENRLGLVVHGDLPQADGHAERCATLDKIDSTPFAGIGPTADAGRQQGGNAAKFVADLPTSMSRRNPYILFSDRRLKRPARGLRAVDQAPRTGCR
jgi:hypothetical protein